MNFYENIEKYIDGDLRGEELVKMETALTNDTALKREYLFRKEINAAIQEDEILNLRDQLQRISESHNNQSSNPAVVRWFSKRKSVMAAASLALLFGLGGIGYFYLNQPTTSDKIYKTYYEPYEATIAYRSANTEINSLLTEAYEKYQAEQYDEALQLFSEVLEKREDMAANLYSGISYMEIEKYQKAKKSFDSVIEDKDNLFIEQAKWYMSMCYIKIGNISNAKIYLKELASESEYYKSRANEVIAKLDKIKKD